MPSCLVVDDNPVVRKLARRFLESGGYAVAEAANGASALQACRSALPDCVLLDWHMPGMSGIECLRLLRAEFGPDEPVVVFCTAETDMNFIAEALENGAQEYIMKPFDAEILLGKLAQVGPA